MKDLTLLKELILEKVDLTETMVNYGIRFTFDPTNSMEAQFHCPFHGGNDTKPSARVYKESKSCWCWVCKKVRNVINVVMEKESLGYVEGIKFILDKWRIDTSGISDAPSLETKRPENPSESWTELIRLRGMIKERRRRMPTEKYAAVVTAWYMIAFDQSQEKPVREQIKKLKSRLRTL